MTRPSESEYHPPFHAGYVGLVPETEILPVLEEQKAVFLRIAAATPADRERFRYAPDKWSVREVVGHLTDCERVFGYRAFAISRGEKAALPAFDENAYVAATAYDDVPLAELVDELVATREGHLAFLRRLTAGEWPRVGTASGRPITVRALAWIMAGHPRHHLALLRDRYGID